MRKFTENSQLGSVYTAEPTFESPALGEDKQYSNNDFL